MLNLTKAVKRRSLVHSPYPFSSAKRNKDWLLTDPAKLKLLMDAFNQHPAHEDIERPGYVRDLLYKGYRRFRPSLWNNNGDMVLEKDGPFFSMTEWITCELQFNQGLVLDENSPVLAKISDGSRSVFEAIAGSRVANPTSFPQVSANLLREHKLTGYKAFKWSRLYILHNSAFGKPGMDWEKLICERVGNKLVALDYFKGSPETQGVFDATIRSMFHRHLEISEPKVMSVRSVAKDWVF